MKFDLLWKEAVAIGLEFGIKCYSTFTKKMERLTGQKSRAVMLMLTVNARSYLIEFSDLAAEGAADTKQPGESPVLRKPGSNLRETIQGNRFFELVWKVEQDTPQDFLEIDGKYQTRNDINGPVKKLLQTFLEV